MAKARRRNPKKKTTKKSPAKQRSRSRAKDQPRCGLCGSTGNLTKTECCDQWICDDEDEYVLFSYERNSCHRNHRRYTLCGFHDGEGHPGRWQDCPRCRESFETEMYVYYGTNEYNFEVLSDPPDFEPTHCSRCGRTIDLGMGGYSVQRHEYFCGPCTTKKLGRPF